MEDAQPADVPLCADFAGFAAVADLRLPTGAGGEGCRRQHEGRKSGG